MNDISECALVKEYIYSTRHASKGFDSHLEGMVRGLRRVSHWWIGVSLLWPPLDLEYDWFVSSRVKRLGNGYKTRFWQ